MCVCERVCVFQRERKREREREKEREMSHGQNDVTNALLFVFFSQTTENVLFCVTAKRNISITIVQFMIQA